ncbi:MAG TPA: hypothetical protein VEO53_16620 [Candidatus Binatia bacterium]|nr:hypothetical protein [Candidatus Binatia bacterium]
MKIAAQAVIMVAEFIAAALLSEAELRYVARMLPTIVQVGRMLPTVVVAAVDNTYYGADFGCRLTSGYTNLQMQDSPSLTCLSPVKKLTFRPT